MAMVTRRGKWHPPPPPTPKILQLPRRSRRPRTSTSAAAAAKPVVVKVVHAAKPSSPPPEERELPCGRLEALFEQERSFFTIERRARVESSNSSSSSSSARPAAAARSGDVSRESRVDSEEEKWRFQAEILRAECNFLRIEREVALKKLERNRAQTDAALRSAVETLVSGRKKIDGSQSIGNVLKEVEGKLEELQNRRRRGSCSGGKEAELGWRSGTSNFDKKAILLRRRLQEMNVREMMPKRKDRLHNVKEGIQNEEEEEEEICVREIREIATETTTTNNNNIYTKNSSSEKDRRSTCVQSNRNSRLPDVELLRRKMEGISKGMLERVEEYGSVLSSSTCSASFAATAASSFHSASATSVSVATNTCTTSARNEAPKAQREQHQGMMEEEGDGRRCSGRCTEVVTRILEQVRAETEQWGEMQGMLDQVREEMEDLRCSRDFWERCAIQSDQKLRSTNAQAMEWRERARASEHRAWELQRQVMELQAELKELRDDEEEPLLHSLASTTATAAAAAAYSSIKSNSRTRGQQPQHHHQHRKQQQQQKPCFSPCDLHKEKEKEKRVLFCRFLDENTPPPAAATARRRQPFREIGNLTPLFRA